MRGVSTGRIPEGRPGAGIRVVRLHYLADPTWTPERIAKEKAKYPDVSFWNKEMEIDPGARRGQRIFGNFDESVHVVPRPAIVFTPDTHTGWLGGDPHPKTPDAFVWLMVDKEGDMCVPWSWWPDPEIEGKESIDSCVEYIRIVEKSDYLGMPPRYKVMDCAGANFVADEATRENWFDRYRKAGIHFRPAKRNIEWVGYTLLNEAFRLRSYKVDGKFLQRPKLTIWAGCGDNAKLVEQIKKARWRELKAADRDAPEEPEMRHRHLVDCLSYILLDEPRFIQLRRNKGQDMEPIYGPREGMHGGTGW